jgi:hypothetical protein
MTCTNSAAPPRRASARRAARTHGGFPAQRQKGLRAEIAAEARRAIGCLADPVSR